jgi:hypothetical protein
VSLNLTITPVDFPNPLKTIHKECTEDNGAYSDKSLGLWKIEDIKKSLIMRLSRLVNSPLNLDR